MKCDLDLGTLASAEAVLLERTSPEERAEDFLYFHLNCARQSRLRAERMGKDTPDYFHELTLRERALHQADIIARRLRAVGYPFSAHVQALMRSENPS